MRISDWSSDVCSSDLNDRGWFDNPSLGRKMGREKNWFLRPTVVLKIGDAVKETIIAERGRTRGDGSVFQNMPQGAVTGSLGFENLQGNPGYTRTRSEERRVGKGGVRTCRFGWSP